MWPVPVPSSRSHSSGLAGVLAPLPEHRTVLEPCPGSLLPTGESHLMLVSPGVVASQASGTPVHHAVDAAEDAEHSLPALAGACRSPAEYVAQVNRQQEGKEQFQTTA